MGKKMVQTGKPLDIGKMVMLTGRDALYTIGKYKVRIMNFSEGQTVEADDLVEQDGYLWGIRKLKETASELRKPYDSIAFIAHM